MGRISGLTGIHCTSLPLPLNVQEWHSGSTRSVWQSMQSANSLCHAAEAEEGGPAPGEGQAGGRVVCLLRGRGGTDTTNLNGAFSVCMSSVCTWEQRAGASDRVPALFTKLVQSHQTHAELMQCLCDTLQSLRHDLRVSMRARRQDATQAGLMNHSSFIGISYLSHSTGGGASWPI